MYNQVNEDVPKSNTEHTPKQLDKSKTELFMKEQTTVEMTTTSKPLDQSKLSAFTSQQTQDTENRTTNHVPKQLDHSKMAMFNAQNSTSTVTSTNRVRLFLYFYVCPNLSLLQNS